MKETDKDTEAAREETAVSGEKPVRGKNRKKVIVSAVIVSAVAALIAVLVILSVKSTDKLGKNDAEEVVRDYLSCLASDDSEAFGKLIDPSGFSKYGDEELSGLIRSYFDSVRSNFVKQFGGSFSVDGVETLKNEDLGESDLASLNEKRASDGLDECTAGKYVEVAFRVDSGGKSSNVKGTFSLVLINDIWYVRNTDFDYN